MVENVEVDQIFRLLSCFSHCIKFRGRVKVGFRVKVGLRVRVWLVQSLIDVFPKLP